MTINLCRRQRLALMIGFALSMMPLLFPAWRVSWKEDVLYTSASTREIATKTSFAEKRGFLFTGPLFFSPELSKPYRLTETLTVTPQKIVEGSLDAHGVDVKHILLEVSALLIPALFVTWMLRNWEDAAASPD